MKRLLTIAVLIFSFMFVVAQTPNNHLTFKGIPITGTLENFAQKMEAKGFKKKYSNKRIIGLEGEFAGYSGCKITVFKILIEILFIKWLWIFLQKIRGQD